MVIHLSIIPRIMMTSSNGNIFRVTGHLCWEFTGPGEFPSQRPVTRSFDVFFDLRLNKRLGKQSWGWWFETLSSPLGRHRNDCGLCVKLSKVWISNYISQILWGVITCPCPWYVLLTHKPSNCGHVITVTTVKSHERYGVLNYRQIYCSFNTMFITTKNTSPSPVGYSHKGPVMRKAYTSQDVIMYIVFGFAQALCIIGPL